VGAEYVSKVGKASYACDAVSMAAIFFVSFLFSINGSCGNVRISRVEADHDQMYASLKAR
jgi:hypothetical protein